MSDRLSLPARLTETGIVAIMRAPSCEHVVAAAERLVSAGITCVEVTMTMPDAVATVAVLAKELGDAACVGAGTVLTVEQARACVDAGARFLVSPSSVPEVVAACVPAGIPCLPGALTPSEIVAAWASGAAGVKVFPASIGGPRYLRDVRAPLPHIPLIPTGGVAIDDVANYLSAGAVAVGLGSPLFGDALAGGSLDDLSARARRLVGAVRIAREGRQA